MNRYLSFHDYFYNLFNRKVLKLSIDAGFTCPNRDGNISRKGCIFCSENGAGDFTFSNMSIKEQMMTQRKRLEKKWPDGVNIAYFQNFSGTYKKVEELKKIYYEALDYDNTVGIAIATRADCIDDEIIDLLNEINKNTFLWIELGMQTINNKTLKKINRGYDHSTFDNIINKLNQNNIKTLAHVIFGLPDETREDMMNSIEYINKKDLFGIKIHSLYIQEDSALADIYKKGNLKLISKEEYIDLCTEAIARLKKDIVIHRLTGDPDRKKLIEPKWTADKLAVLSSIQKNLKEKNITQGVKYNANG